MYAYFSVFCRCSISSSLTAGVRSSLAVAYNICKDFQVSSLIAFPQFSFLLQKHAPSVCTKLEKGLVPRLTKPITVVSKPTRPANHRKPVTISVATRSRSAPVHAPLTVIGNNSVTREVRVRGVEEGGGAVYKSSRK